MIFASSCACRAGPRRCASYCGGAWRPRGSWPPRWAPSPATSVCWTIPSPTGVRISRSRKSSHPLDEAVDHALLTRLVELDGELVAVDRGHVAVAELDVEDAVADRIIGDGAGRSSYELALDGERSAPDRATGASAPCLLAAR